MENSILALIDTMTNQQAPPNAPTKFTVLSEIYKEQIASLKEENDSLQKKLETLRNQVDCSICVAQEANCVLRPCGHTLCSECYFEIDRTWSAQRFRIEKEGPPCPFCRQTVVELIPKFRSRSKPKET